MLINCPECKKEISDKAIFCPSCGYPMKEEKLPKKSTRRKRLPNGFGQISFIKGNLRRPYRAMVTIGKTETGRPIARPIKPTAYFETYNDAYVALLEFNKRPADDPNNLTLEELYFEWSEKHYKRIKDPSHYKQVWKHAGPLYKFKVTDIRPVHIKDTIENSALPPKSKSHFKILFNVLFDYAMEKGIIDTNPARNMKTSNIIKKEDLKVKSHIPYTKEEINTIFDRAPYDVLCKFLAIQCYTGFRPGELTEIKRRDIDILNWTIRGGKKTAAGIDRIVPIHAKIRGLVKTAYEEASEIHSDTLFFIFNPGSSIPTHVSYNFLYAMLEEEKKIGLVGMDHKLHDGRKHFVTMAKRWNVDEYAIKRIVGHSIDDITEDTYTERSIEWLASEIAKIKE